MGADRIIEVADDPRWSADLYRDDIHPTPEGMTALARIIDERMQP